MSLLEFTERGIYCQRAGVFIDPWRSVPKALITHAHSDHAQPGCQRYMCTALTGALIRQRIGTHLNIQTVAYGETVHINGVQFSFHPAGHIVGSAQIRVEYANEIWVVSGDYKTEPDGISEPFELLQCHTFVTESTFGLPVFHWPDQNHVFDHLNTWWRQNAQNGITSVVAAYALGKAQRLIQNIDHSIGPVYCHGAVDVINTTLRQAGMPLKRAAHLDDSIPRDQLRKALVIAPGSVLGTAWMKHFDQYMTAAASGWMTLRGRRRWRNVDTGFVLSDHADWNALNHTIAATGCEQVVVTHGYTEVFARWLDGQGFQARAEGTSYEGDTA